MDAQNAIGEQLTQNQQEQMKALSSLEGLLKGISAQDFTQRHTEQVEELRKLANMVQRDLGAQRLNQERLAQNHQEQLAALNAVEELVKGIGARDFAKRHEEQVKSLIDIKRRLEEVSAQQPDKEEMTQTHEEQIRKRESLKDEFNTQLEKIESAVQKFGREQQDKEYVERKHLELLVTLEKKQKVEPDERSIQSAIPEQSSQLRDENAQSKVLSTESVELLSKLQEEKAGVQQQLQYVTNRLDETTRDLEEAKSRAQDAEVEKGEDQLVDFHPTKGEYVDDYQKIEVVAERLSAKGQLRATSKFLECEGIFTPEHTNKDVFEEISQLTMSALDGKKVCIFCYGQTSRGKTFTMNHRVGPPGHDDPNDGIIHRSLALMFEHVNSSREQYQYDMRMSTVDVYINDLIDFFSSRKKHVIKNMDEATGKDMTTQEAVRALIDKALNNRAVGATNANAQSSRSHLILCFRIERTVLKGPDAGNKSTGILNLIDLAGSEKNKETGATGQWLEESKTINSSIFKLNNSITALAEDKPKRAGHTLTRVLEPCLAKGCRVVVFVMVSLLKKDQPEAENTMTKAEMAAKAKLNSKASNPPTSPGGGRSQNPCSFEAA
ncbi:hypothetical protein DL764_004766 [Monosporascus ibericus]|uniref:Kinesin motor domain-containing protein n=1 Tax=Monosporascus ibericus TaxID=155417 RepID=A0A4Q4TD94_9PEZI|nr:hypothetical protein DL764_004766 [Monosporascus ibericus]